MTNNYSYFPKMKVTNCRNLSFPREDDYINHSSCTAYLDSCHNGCTCNTVKTTIIPFASGIPIAMTTLNGGLAGIPAFIGFGNSASGLTTLGSTIDITNSKCALCNFAFSVPRKGVINSISAYFSTAVALSRFRSPVTVNAQLYSSDVPNNVFKPIGEKVILSPTLSSADGIGGSCNGIVNDLSVPVTAQTRLMMVFSVSSSSSSLANTVIGYASAGVSII